MIKSFEREDRVFVTVASKVWSVVAFAVTACWKCIITTVFCWLSLFLRIITLANHDSSLGTACLFKALTWSLGSGEQQICSSHPQSKVTWPWLFRQNCLCPMVPPGSKSCPPITRGQRSRTRAQGHGWRHAPVHRGPPLAEQMTPRCFYGNSDSLDQVCVVWRSNRVRVPPVNVLFRIGLYFSFALPRHAQPYINMCSAFEGCKSLDLHCFEWSLRRDILAPGKAQMADLVLGSVCGQQRRNSFWKVSPEKICTLSSFFWMAG